MRLAIFIAGDYIIVMQCPRCEDSDHLMIRNNTGIERIMVFFTKLRKYRCLDCDNVFRMPDRRMRPREQRQTAPSLSHAHEREFSTRLS